LLENEQTVHSDQDLGILEYATAKSDADIDWADLSRPLFEESA